MDIELRQLERLAHVDPNPYNLANLLLALARLEDYTQMDNLIGGELIPGVQTFWKPIEIFNQVDQYLATWEDLYNPFRTFWRIFLQLRLNKYTYLSFMPSGGLIGPPVLAIFFECHALSFENIDETDISGRIVHTSQRLHRIQDANEELAMALNDLPLFCGSKKWISQKVEMNKKWDDSHDFICAEHPVDYTLLMSLFA